MRRLIASGLLFASMLVASQAPGQEALTAKERFTALTTDEYFTPYLAVSQTPDGTDPAAPAAAGVPGAAAAQPPAPAGAGR